MATANVKIPPFGGDNFTSWLKGFRMSMLMMDFEDRDDKQAKFFAVCLIEGSVAAQWFDSQMEEVKASWRLLVEALKARFGDTEDDRHAAFRDLVGMKLSDKDVGQTNSDGLPKQVVWARKVAVLATKAGKDENNNNAYLVYNNVGPHLQTILSNTNCTRSIAAITNKVETLTPVEQESLSNAVRREAEANTLSLQLQHLERQLSQTRQPLSQLNNQNLNVPSYNRSQSAGVENVNIELGQFPNTAKGLADYKNAVNAFYGRYGPTATSSLSRPFPLSPGTVPAGNNECFNCGKADHLRVNCPARVALPINEQRFRGMSMQKKRNEPNFGPATGSNTATPIRSMSTSGWNEGPDHFAHLNYLPPLTPDQSPKYLSSDGRFQHLPDLGSEAGNEEDLDL